MSPAAPAPSVEKSRRLRGKSGGSTFPAGYCAKESSMRRRSEFRICISPARVEALPFGDASFDAVVCCGSLHLFTDTVAALKEMARVMKLGAVLATFTFTAGEGGLLKYESFRRWSRDRHGLHVFALDDLSRDLTSSGFEDFQPEVVGSVLTFSARKRPSDQAE
ncbi:MAG: methyltransferase domain-containing protein [Roseiarcus sp.]